MHLHNILCLTGWLFTRTLKKKRKPLVGDSQKWLWLPIYMGVNIQTFHRGQVVISGGCLQQEWSHGKYHINAPTSPPPPPLPLNKHPI